MTRNKDKICQVTNCNKPAFCKGYCSKHYQQIKFKGQIQQKSFLEIPGLCRNLGCGKPVFAKGLCQMCYVRQRKIN